MISYRAPFLVTYQIKRHRLRGTCPTIDGAKVPGNLAMSAIENGHNGYFFSCLKVIVWLSDAFQVSPYTSNPVVKLNVLVDIFDCFYSRFTILVTINKATELRKKLPTFEYNFELTKLEYKFKFQYSVFMK